MTERSKVQMPRHVAIIMDGNGRWAKARGKHRTQGHRAGAEAVRRSITFARRNGIEALTLFAFSSENWSRPRHEVSVLMELFLNVLKREVAELDAHDIRLNVVGDRTRFSPRLQAQIRQAEATTAHNTALQLNIAANYGGRWDLVQAARQLAADSADGKLEPADIDETKLGQRLALAGQPEPDLLIRTGGDVRVSNFLLWQLAYAELYFSDVLWPDFDEEEFARAVDCFVRRERRFGLTSEQIKALLGAGD